VLSLITAVLLAFASEGLRPLQEANIKLDTKISILRSVHISSTERDEIEQAYATTIQEMVVNASGEEITSMKVTDIVLKDELEKPVHERHLPLYVYTGPDQKKRYIIPMRGVGLWGPIWGYISIEEDFNTVYGSFFAHKSETPGLGAEIAEPAFQEQFRGKKIMGTNNAFVSVHVVKKAAKFDLGNEHRVDGITGGTITSNGTDKMLKVCIEPYLPYFEKLKNPS
jgi:Na+-transporting NADH:ubiquinone oxidoreductase subunit C